MQHETNHTAGAMRAAIYVNGRHRLGLSEHGIKSLAERIDEQTNLPGLVEAAKAARVQLEYMLNEVPEAYPNMGSELQSRIDELTAQIAKAGAS